MAVASGPHSYGHRSYDDELYGYYSSQQADDDAAAQSDYVASVGYHGDEAMETERTYNNEYNDENDYHDIEREVTGYHDSPTPTSSGYHDNPAPTSSGYRGKLYRKGAYTHDKTADDEGHEEEETDGHGTRYHHTETYIIADDDEADEVDVTLERTVYYQNTADAVMNETDLSSERTVYYKNTNDDDDEHRSSSGFRDNSSSSLSSSRLFRPFRYPQDDDMEVSTAFREDQFDEPESSRHEEDPTNDFETVDLYEEALNSESEYTDELLRRYSRPVTELLDDLVLEEERYDDWALTQETKGRATGNDMDDADGNAEDVERFVQIPPPFSMYERLAVVATMPSNRTVVPDTTKDTLPFVASTLEYTLFVNDAQSTAQANAKTVAQSELDIVKKLTRLERKRRKETGEPPAVFIRIMKRAAATEPNERPPNVCANGVHCTDKTCRKCHDAYRSTDGVVSSIGLYCWLGRECTNGECGFEHPDGRERVAETENAPRTAPAVIRNIHSAACRFGDKCVVRDCVFTHHPRDDNGDDNVSLYDWDRTTQWEPEPVVFVPCADAFSYPQQFIPYDAENPTDLYSAEVKGATEIVAAGVEALSGGNKGHSLMQKMGWTPGEGMGRRKRGLLEPVRAVVRPRCLGLGKSID